MNSMKIAGFVAAAMFLLFFTACGGGGVLGDGDNKFTGEMMSVKGGTFTMGCTPEQGGECYSGEKPTRQVTLSDFYIGKYEVTQAQWKAVLGDDNNPSNFKGDNLPVENVSWRDVQFFITTLNQKTGGNYRLPTEAEWEYAARGGNKSQGYKYSGGNNINEVAWHGGNSEGRTHPVGAKAPNELGIHDMSGNVWEWVNDWYRDYNSGSVSDPQGPSKGSGRVRRGGSWGGDARGARVSNRFNANLVARSDYVGFRIARDSN